MGPALHGAGSASGRVPVYVLAGGRSRRFGRDKARVRIGGEPLLLRVNRELRPSATRVRGVRGERSGYADRGVATMPDPIPGRGPLGGLLAALEDAAPAPWLFLAACDQVGIRPEWAEALLAARRPGARAVAYRTDRYHPLFAVYHTDLENEVRRRVEASALTMQRLLADVPAVVLPAPSGFDELVNLNRPNDLRAVRG